MGNFHYENKYFLFFSYLIQLYPRIIFLFLSFYVSTSVSVSFSVLFFFLFLYWFVSSLFYSVLLIYKLYFSYLFLSIFSLFFPTLSQLASVRQIIDFQYSRFDFKKWNQFSGYVWVLESCYVIKKSLAAFSDVNFSLSIKH